MTLTADKPPRPFAAAKKQRGRLPWAALLLAFTIAALGGASFTSAEEKTLDQQFQQGLRDRRLFQLAKAECRFRLDDPQLSSADRGRFTIELIRNYAEHAIHSPPEKRIALWNKAGQTAADFAAAHPQHPQLLVVKLQDALALLAQGELARQESEISTAREQALTAARQTIRTAARALEQLEKEFAAEISARGAKEPDEDRLSDDELAAFLHHIHYHRARTLRNQALCYPPGDDSRIAALLQATEMLEKPLGRLAINDPLAWRMRIDQIVSLRLLEQYKQAADKLAALDKDNPPPAIKQRALAEIVRLALDSGKPQAALAVLGKATTPSRRSAEFDFAAFEVYLSLWQAAEKKQNKQQADLYRKQAVALASLIENTHGYYWGRRADLMLVESAGSMAGGGDLQILIRTANNFYLNEQFDDALAAYDKAAQNAQAAENFAQTFDLLYKAAAIEQQRRRHLQAATRLERLSMTFRDHQQAGQAHLLAAWNIAQLAAGRPKLIEQYDALLVKHLQLWPQDPSTSAAHGWLGDLRRGEQKWKQALAAYGKVSPQSNGYEPAIRSAALCALNLLKQLRADGQPLEEEAASAARFFQNVYRDKNEQDPWTPLDRLAALAAAEIHLQYSPGGFAKAETILQTALDHADGADEPWLASARSLMAAALAGQNRIDEAAAYLAQLGGTDPQRLLEMTQSLSKMVRSAEPPLRKELAALLLKAVELLAPRQQKLTPAQQYSLKLLQAEGLAATGQTSAANALYKELSRQRPKHGPTQQAYGDFLLASDDRQLLGEALSQWRRIARGSKPNTGRWVRAKYSVALAQYKLGQKKEAAALIRYLQATANLDASPLKAEFAKLLRKCEN